MFKSKLTTIVAITALVIAVFGATPLGQAAGRFVLPKNSVGAAQLKKNAVSGKKLTTNAVSGVKIAKDAVTGANVKDGSVLTADLAAGQLAAGAKGPKGDPGRSIVAASLDDAGILILTHDDGTIVTCDFYPLLEARR